MAAPDWKELQKRLDSLTPEEKVQLAEYLMRQAAEGGIKPTGDLSQFRGIIKLSVDPMEFQRSVRGEWP